jgi:hypothetical protein
MEMSELSIVNVIAGTLDTSSVAPFVELDNIDSVFYYLFENYSGMKGQIDFVNGKPVIGTKLFVVTLTYIKVEDITYGKVLKLLNHLLPS